MNLTQCKNDYLSNAARYAKYRYNGHVYGISLNNTNRTAQLITVQGCRDICGHGIEYYAWKDSSTTITTWVLPVLGLLLQAPYESNEFWRTLEALARWIGNPIAALSYTLWNIKVTSKCALMVDMATIYEDVPAQGSPFAQIRDSLYILSVMNQYTTKQRMPDIEAERLLRIALFSDSLKLTNFDDSAPDLIQRRRELADQIRKERKKGVIPVFITTMWFLFSLAISIQSAYGQLGYNATAHNLALGFLLSWLPVLILTTVVDRNPVAAQSILIELNGLLDDVRSALLDPNLRDTYMRDTGRTREDFAWTNALSNEDYFRQDFFTQFAGQGRLRWHYGVAHSILAGIESAIVAESGRNWLRDAELARTVMVLGPERLVGLRWFDIRMIWQILCAILIVCGTVGGAFIISFWTPTVGLGCRSGGYLIFTVIALGIFAAELLVWWLSPDGTASPPWLGNHLSQNLITHWGSNLDHRLSRADSDGRRLITALRFRFRQAYRWWTGLTFRDSIEVFILRPCEIVNTAWLIYIIFAQTFGAYQNCNCIASTWGSIGGYVDFLDEEVYRANGVEYYWGFGLALSCTVMALGFAFVVAEYCTQSHLSTEDYEKAAQGLRWTRWFKKRTEFCRSLPDYVIILSERVCNKFLGKHDSHDKRSLVWASKARHPEIPRLVVEAQSLSGAADDEPENSLMEGSIGSADVLLQRLPTAE